MCFAPKIKMPKMDTQQIRAVEPAPLTEEVSSVEFGGGSSDEDTTESEVSGRKDLKVERDDSVMKSKMKSKSGTSSRMKSSIRKSVFGGGKK